MGITNDETLIEAVQHAAHPLLGTGQDYDALMNLIGDARFVLLQGLKDGGRRRAIQFVSC